MNRTEIVRVFEFATDATTPVTGAAGTSIAADAVENDDVPAEFVDATAHVYRAPAVSPVTVPGPVAEPVAVRVVPPVLDVHRAVFAVTGAPDGLAGNENDTAVRSS